MNKLGFGFWYPLIISALSIMFSVFALVDMKRLELKHKKELELWTNGKEINKERMDKLGGF